MVSIFRVVQKRLKNFKRNFSFSTKVKLSSKPSVDCREFLQRINERKVFTVKHNRDKVLVSIFLVIQNDQKWLKVFLPELVKYTKDITYEVIVIDNVSQDGSLQLLQSYSDIFSLKIIKNKERLSFSCANNRAAKEAQGKYIVVLKVGILPLRGWLSQLIHCANTEKNIGIVAASLVYRASFIRRVINQRDYLYQKGVFLSDEVTQYRPYFIFEKQLEDMECLISARRGVISSLCLLVPRNTYLLAGGLDESFMEYGEDIDLGLKLHQMGFVNKYAKDAVLAITQPYFGRKKESEAVKNDSRKLQERWYRTIKQSYWREKIFDEGRMFSETPFTIAIAVTDHGPGVTAGDYFTAQELAQALELFGWKVSYLSRKKGEWYQISDNVDAVLNLLDAYDLGKIPKRKKRLLKIAWARNWFDLWCERSCFDGYDVVFSSSQKSCDYINEHSQQRAFLLPIASNPERFQETPECSNREFYTSDICFTGSYWDYPRDIIDALSQEVLNKYNFSIFGAHWGKVEKFKKYTKGFIDYEAIPCAYHYTKIVIDDANHVTKPYGSVNSRVFDAIMSGALVITNGAEGSRELFNGGLPFYENRSELTRLIKYFLNNEDKRIERVRALRKIVIEKHTYKQRAEVFKNILINRLLLTSIAIKVPAPSWSDACNWGDYHMANSLKQELEKENYRVILQVLPEWDSQEGSECDVVIVFRGLSRYLIKPHQINIMWNISHPDKVSLEEYGEYDQVYIASDFWAEKISKQVSVPVESMLQCSNPDVFFEPSDEEKKACRQELLYVGNSRKIYRKALQDLLPTDYDLSVYGKNWQGLIPEVYIKAEHISNDKLYKYYGSADILLNDHWSDMREKGFISNRIFDGLACGALIITDRVEAMGELESFVHIYETKVDLAKLIEDCLANLGSRQRQVSLAKEYVLNGHTFKHRARKISEYIEYKLNLPQT